MPIRTILKIFNCSTSTAISLLLSVFLVGTAEWVTAQTPVNSTARPVPRKVPYREHGQADKSLAETNKEQLPDTIPLYFGTYIGVDLYGIGNKLFGSDIIASEISVAVNLKNRYIPTLELGMGAADSWSDDGIHYKSKATPFFRIGADYNCLAKKKNKNNSLCVGLRYAFTSFNYDVSSMSAEDPIWGDAIGNPGLPDDIWGGESVMFNHPGMKGKMSWLEFVLGVKAQIYRNFYMGWTLRLKYKLAMKPGEYGDPWYVPGFGQYKANNIGVTYSFIYKLPY